MKPQMLRGLLQNLLLSGLSICVTLIMGEMGVRLLVPEYLTSPHPQGMYISDQVRGYALAPDFHASLKSPEFQTSISTNSQGLRERELGPKAPGTFRVLVLGDSFVFGQGVDAELAFPRLLESELAKYRPDIKTQVINAGVPGYGTDQEFALLQELGWSYSPDLVIVNMFAGNDVNDNLIGGKERRSVRNGFLYDEYQARQKASKYRIVGPLTSWLAVYSRLYVFMRTPLDVIQWSRGTRLPVPQEHLEAIQIPLSQEFRDGLVLTESILKQMTDQASQHGAHLMIVVVPSAVQVDDTLWNETISVYRLSAANYDRAQPGKLFVQFGQEVGLPVFDLMPDFVNVDSAYFKNDIHWNTKGHMIAARAISRFLVADSQLLGSK
jgi:lysophospholipase L1-like esterase